MVDQSVLENYWCDKFLGTAPQVGGTTKILGPRTDTALV